MIEIIPAIDLIEGKCVRLIQGDYARKTVYNENPLEVAKQFEGIGIRRLHLVDLDGAKKGEVVNLAVLEKIASQTTLSIDFGGGIKTGISIQQVFDSGAAMAAIGSIAVKDSELFYGWIAKYGAEKLFLGADVKKDKIAVNGWFEETDIHILDFIKQHVAQGIKHIFCTDISKDGLLQGPSTELYRDILTAFPNIELVASGGVSQWSDVEDIENTGCTGIIIGKAIYEKKISLEKIKNYMYSC